MSDTSTTIVPVITEYPNRSRKAQEIVNWLIDIQAIKAFKDDCILSSEQGYPIDTGAKALTSTPEYLPYELNTNGLQVITERSVFDAGENGLDSFVCPNCNEDILREDWRFDDYMETGNALLMCPLCKRANDINDYNMEPAWGFSDLGFTFWNWTDLTEDFIKEFEQKLGCKVKVVESHI
jgi:uncharacterized protein YbaR (Trm112 family)